MSKTRTSPRRLGPTLSFMRALWDLNHSLEVISVRMLRTIGITAQQRFMIRIVARLGPISAGRLARMLHVHPGTLSAALNRLERRGLLTRKRDPVDQRRVMIHLTPRGKRLDAALPANVERAVSVALRRGGATEARELLRTLSRLAEELRDQSV